MTDVVALLQQITDIGRNPTGPGWTRSGFSPAERALREWFTASAWDRGWEVDIDANGIAWAWVTDPGDDAVVVGSHLDSVPGGGEFDGPLGVASAIAAADALQATGRLATARRPLAIAVFPEEEGSRFGLPCLGSRLLTGAVGPARARALTDDRGDAFAQVLASHGLDAALVGRDAQRLGRIGSYLGLHLDQGRAVAEAGSPVGIAASVVGHGR